MHSGQALRPLPLGPHSRYPAFHRLVQQQATLIWAPSAPGKGRTRSQSRSENSCEGAPGGLSGPGPGLLASAQALISGCETGPAAGSELSGGGCLGFSLSPSSAPALPRGGGAGGGGSARLAPPGLRSRSPHTLLILAAKLRGRGARALRTPAALPPRWPPRVGTSPGRLTRE